MNNNSGMNLPVQLVLELSKETMKNHVNLIDLRIELDELNKQERVQTRIKNKRSNEAILVCEKFIQIAQNPNNVIFVSVDDYSMIIPGPILNQIEQVKLEIEQVNMLKIINHDIKNRDNPLYRWWHRIKGTT